MTPTELADALDRERASLLERYDNSHPSTVGLADLFAASATALRRLGRVEEAAKVLLANAECPQDDHSYNCEAQITECGKCDCYLPALREALRSGG